MVVLEERLIGVIKAEEGGEIDGRLLLLVAEDSGRGAVQEAGAGGNQVVREVIDVGWETRSALVVW